MFFEHIEDRTLSKCPLLQFITIVKAFSDYKFYIIDDLESKNIVLQSKKHLSHVSIKIFTIII